MATAELRDGVPYWTERMYKPGGGQDHLGLGSVVTNRVLPRLSPGINVLTVHPRYWSFYSFVISEFWKRDLPRTKSSFRSWYRPLECIYSVACNLCTNDGHIGSPVGTRQISGIVAADPDGYDPRFGYMKTPDGGFGLYYGSVMQTLGLVVLTDRAVGVPVDAVTPTGQVVAEAFRTAISDTDYYQHWIDRHDELVPAAVVAEYAEQACFCKLRLDSAPDRELLVDAFLHAGEDTTAVARRKTLRFMCEISAQSQGFPINQWSFRNLIYFGADDPDGNGSVATFLPSKEISSTARRWRLYQAREYYNAALNEMWRRLTNWGKDADGVEFPPTLSEVLDSLDRIDFESFAATYSENYEIDLLVGGFDASTPFSELLDWARAAAGITDSLDDRWALDADLNEDYLIDWLGYGQLSEESGPDSLAAAFLLLTLVAARFWEPALALVAPDDWFPIVEGGRDRLGIQRFLSDLRERSQSGATVGDVIRWVTSDYVISQHERVAAVKLPTTGDTFRFRREGGRLRFFEQDALVSMNDSRFNALSTIIYEIGWSGHLHNAAHQLTAEGEEFRSAGDLPPTGRLNITQLSEESA